MVVNDKKTIQKMKNKGQLSIEKDIMKYEKITARSLNEVQVSTYKSKNVTVLGHPRFQFLAKRVGENTGILKQPDTFEIKYTEFLYQLWQWEIIFSAIFFYIFLYGNILFCFFQTGSGCPRSTHSQLPKSTLKHVSNFTRLTKLFSSKTVSNN